MDVFPPDERMDFAERDLCALVGERFMPHRLGGTLEDWRARPIKDRMVALNEALVWIEGVGPPQPGLKIVRGARGLWFVKRGEETIGKGYPSEAEASAASVASAIA